MTQKQISFDLRKGILIRDQFQCIINLFINFEHKTPRTIWDYNTTCCTFAIKPVKFRVAGYGKFGTREIRYKLLS